PTPTAVALFRYLATRIVKRNFVPIVRVGSAALLSAVATVLLDMVASSVNSSPKRLPRRRRGPRRSLSRYVGNCTRGSALECGAGGPQRALRPPSSILYPPGGVGANSWGTPMRDAEILSVVRDLRARAREISAGAETFNDADARQRMRAIAATYGKLA